MVLLKRLANQLNEFFMSPRVVIYMAAEENFETTRIEWKLVQPITPIIKLRLAAVTNKSLESCQN
ncbi:ATV_HP_G0098740.mRNA.1.CDS.1 [Saccharomyces cerevisiae]|nr:ATV_HP_G0098740.mRNA.1.CDS.1 [Saccharomyces cerevisiae]CAI6573987.1 ATV_HP_G0098740.mRNA.1.CDS.1 [Saccharomyces cerevisiae]